MESKKKHRFIEQFFQIFRKKSATVLDLDSNSNATHKQRPVKRNSSLMILQRNPNVFRHPDLGSSVFKDLQNLNFSSTKFQASEINSDIVQQQIAKTALESSPRQRKRHSYYEKLETNHETGKLGKEENIFQYSCIDQSLAGQECMKRGNCKLCRSHFDIRNKGERDGAAIRGIVSAVKASGKVTVTKADISQNPSHDSGFDQNTYVATGQNTYVATGQNTCVATGQNTYVTTGQNTCVATGQNTFVATSQNTRVATGQNTYVTTGQNTCVATGQSTYVATGQNTFVATSQNTRVATGQNTYVTTGQNTRVATGQNTRVATGKNTRVATGQNTFVATSQNTRVATGQNTRVATSQNTRVATGKNTRVATGQNTCVAVDPKFEASLQHINKTYREFNASIRNALSQNFTSSKSPWSQSSSSSFEADDNDDFLVKRIVRKTRSQRDLRHRRLSIIPSGIVDVFPFMSKRRHTDSSDETVTNGRRSQSAEVLEQWKGLSGRPRESLPGVAWEMRSAVRRRESLPRLAAGKIDGWSTTRNRDSMYTGSAVGTIADRSVSSSFPTRAKSTNHLDRRRCLASSHPPPPYPLHGGAAFQSPSLDRDVRSPSAICHFSAVQHPCVNAVMDTSDRPTMETSSPIELLRHAANCGHLARVHELLAEGATLDKDQDGCTVLHYAAAGGHPEVVELLLKQGCPADAKDKVGYTALHLAASRGHIDVVRVLLTAFAKIDRQDNQGNTALHEAAWNGYSQTIQLLVMHKANINAVNKTGCTPLHMAAQTGHNQSARVLLFGGCNPNLKNNFGDAALHTAARYGHAGVTMILVSARAKVNQQNKNGDTALHIAAAQKRRKIARILVDAGVNCSIKNKQSEKAEDVAARKKFTDILEVIGTKAVRKKRQSIGPSSQGMSPESGSSVPPTEKKRSKLLTFFSRRNNNDTSSDGRRRLPQQKSLDLGSKTPCGLGSPEDLLDQFYMHQSQTKKLSQEPSPFGSSYRDSRLPEDLSQDQHKGRRNHGSRKGGGGSREGRLQQCASTDTFTFDRKNPKLEVYQGSERDLYVDSRFNVYYIPKGAEFLDDRVYRSRSDDTLSLGSAHRNRMPVVDDDDMYDDDDDYKCTTLKSRKETRAKDSVNDSTQSVTHRAQIEPRPHASNGFCVSETVEMKEGRSLMNENGAFLDGNGIHPNEYESNPKENRSVQKERYVGLHQTREHPPFATKQVFTASEGYLDVTDSQNLDEAEDDEFRNPPLRRRGGGCSFEDVHQFHDAAKSPESSAEQERPESLSFYDIDHVQSSKPQGRNSQTWNVMKSRQPLSLYLTCTYDGLDPMSNTTSV